MIKLRLLNPKLQFIPLSSTGKIHARWNGINANTGVDLAQFTMCGRDVTRSPLVAREMDTERLCGSCRSSLMTYSPQVELVREVSA